MCTSYLIIITLFSSFTRVFSAPGITISSFGKTYNGSDVNAYAIENKNGMVIKVIEYGATLVSVKVPTSGNAKEELLIGLSDVLSYEKLNQSKAQPYFGATIGRYANRITNATFTYNGTVYNLTGDLHGGMFGFDKQLWNSVQLGDRSVQFHYFSKDMDQGYPGNLHAYSTFTLTDENEIQYTYGASTDKTTPVSMTNHAYWNLAGAGSGDVYGHQVQILANYRVEVDSQLYPKYIVKVDNSPYDLRNLTNLGDAMKLTNSSNYTPQFGFDTAYVFLNASRQNLTKVVRVVEPKSGRSLEISTTQPSIQFYTGNFLDNSTLISNGRYTQYHGAIVFEPQMVPDAPNHKSFPSPWLLAPGDWYSHHSIYKFGFPTSQGQGASASGIRQVNMMMLMVVMVFVRIFNYDQ